jgi:hypothetical protein
MSKVVISQPFYLPWIGIFEQMRHCDIFVHYDDALYSKGSLVNRVQVKTVNGPSWLTVPISYNYPAYISELEIDNKKDWATKHYKTLQNVLSGLPHYEDAMKIVEGYLNQKYENLIDLNIQFTEAIARYLSCSCEFKKSSDLKVDGKSSEKVLNICKSLRASQYTSGHGALKYLDHELLSSNGIETYYIDYKHAPYPQKFGGFTPYISVLSLIASMGKSSHLNLISPVVHWDEFKNKISENK